MLATLRPRCQDSAASRCVLRNLAVQTFSLLLVAALALSSLGPMLDHHFAERHTGHQHLYLGSALPDHSHSYERSHAHHGEWMYGPAAVGSPSDGIVYVMPNDGSGHAAADIVMRLLVQRLRLGADDGGLFLKTSPSNDDSLTGIIVAPSKRPPRA